MLDYYVEQTKEVTKRINVHEHRAPTDESLRLLTEMEEKAKERLVSVVKIENNTFKAIWFAFEESIERSFTIDCRFKLNGEEHKIIFSVDSRLNHSEIAEEVLKKLQEKMAFILTKDLITTENISAVLFREGARW